MTSPKIGEALCDADAVENGAMAENLIVRKCNDCGTVWAHDSLATLLFCPSCLEPVGELLAGS